jgi:molecular chaperone DnaK (HSP70)
MPINIDDKQVNARLAKIAKAQSVRTSKRSLALAILRAATRMNKKELSAWLASMLK